MTGGATARHRENEMGALGNLVWFLMGGCITACAWALAGVLMYATVVGIPWGRACFTFANMAALPFGRMAVPRKDLGKKDPGTGPWGALGNVLWFALAGLWLALGHAAIGAMYCVTVIGIPFGVQHFKLGGLAMAPIGKQIVPVGVAQLAAADAAKAQYATLRGE